MLQGLLKTSVAIGYAHTLRHGMLGVVETADAEPRLQGAREAVAKCNPLRMCAGTPERAR
jgi:hypothetical protein